MGIDKNSFKSKSVEYSTPIEIVMPLKNEFNLVLDVCASIDNHKCAKYYTKEHDSLNRKWHKIGNSWMNPPWSRELKKWVEKAYNESLKGITVVCLLPVRTNTLWWHRLIIDTGAEVRFLKGEIKFNGMDRGLWMPCSIVIFHASQSHGGTNGK